MNPASESLFLSLPDAQLALFVHSSQASNSLSSCDSSCKLQLCFICNGTFVWAFSTSFLLWAHTFLQFSAVVTLSFKSLLAIVNLMLSYPCFLLLFHLLIALNFQFFTMASKTLWHLNFLLLFLQPMLPQRTHVHESLLLPFDAVTHFSKSIGQFLRNYIIFYWYLIELCLKLSWGQIVFWLSFNTNNSITLHVIPA